MQFSEFERRARAVWESIPARYRQGVDGLIVDRGAKAHDEDPDVYTLGECVTEEYPSQYGGPETIRSAVVLYYGSFREVARDDDEFDWQDEIRETLMHELGHHLESLATEDALEDLDYAVDENYKRVRGEPFDPLFYRAGENIEATEAIEAMEAIKAIKGVKAFAVDADIFLEVRTQIPASLTCEFVWEGNRYRVALPEAEADVTYHYVAGGPDTGTSDFCIVRVVERGLLATLRAALRSDYTVHERDVTAEAVS
jgi:predicted Zn-dependent protease with MMP-like domain